MYYKKNIFIKVEPNETKEYFTDLGLLKYDLTTKSFYNSEKREIVKVNYWFEEIKTFEDSSHVVMKYLADNHHPHTTSIVTSTSSQVLEGFKSTGEDFRFIKD
ncbi:hypothetical protein AS589_09245 [Empedobacter brevis]|uniref:hypothetical protein n=1 Tax=Empedobacter brevis TaxID=247 RepID=UPI0013204F3A|nr:hypothetical protein [Empedobacter brevis]QHC84940.1 hypothetical protein AS589_09245 [Empedobacter brevis]